MDTVQPDQPHPGIADVSVNHKQDENETCQEADTGRDHDLYDDDDNQALADNEYKAQKPTNQMRS